MKGAPKAPLERFKEYKRSEVSLSGWAVELLTFQKIETLLWDEMGISLHTHCLAW